MNLDGVSRETSERLAIYKSLLIKWNSKINLVSPSSLKAAEARHFQDSLQLLQYAEPTIKSWVDLGSGGGFPGLVIAIALADTDTQVTLIESDQRKSAFLRAVLRETGTKASVISARIEKADPFPADVVSARALAPLPKLIALSFPFLTSSSTCLFLKGKTHKQELADAAHDWHFTAETPVSVTDPDSAILVLKDIQHA